MTAVRWLAATLALACLLAAAVGEEAASEKGSATELFQDADNNHNGELSLSEFKLFVEESKANEGSWFSSPGFLGATANGFVMIMITEVGDKTFFVAAIMAMKHNRSWVFMAVMAAMAVMTVLSVGIGVVLPSLLPRLYTHYAAALLFVYFGVALLREAPSLNAGVSDELEEVEEELATPAPDSASREEREPLVADAEAGKGLDDGASSLTSRTAGRGDGGATAPRAASPTPAARAPKGFVEVVTSVFTITFLAEWGDRSQIATIALAAAKDAVGVCIGGIVGHAVCTAVAVIGGRLLAARISERTVAYVGGSLFLVFALHSFLVGPGTDEVGGHGLLGMLTGGAAVEE